LKASACLAVKKAAQLEMNDRGIQMLVSEDGKSKPGGITPMTTARL
jgi:hypothetical protein